MADFFQRLLEVAVDNKELTGNYLQVWGELGEIYAALKFGCKRHKPKTQGSDGRLGNDWVEVKTISPEKSEPKVEVKRAGNLNKLIVVKISPKFEFEARIIDRKHLEKSKKPVAQVKWERCRNSKRDSEQPNATPEWTESLTMIRKRRGQGFGRPGQGDSSQVHTLTVDGEQSFSNH